MLKLKALQEAFLNKVADIVIKRISDSNSNWLNNIQYKVKAKNIEGQLKLSQIEDFEDEVTGIAERVAENLRDTATEAGAEAAEETLKNANFEVSVSF